MQILAVRLNELATVLVILAKEVEQVTFCDTDFRYADFIYWINICSVYDVFSYGLL